MLALRPVSTTTLCKKQIRSSSCQYQRCEWASSQAANQQSASATLCPNQSSLTVAERMDAIRNLNRLESLDALYMLEPRFSGASLASVCRLFQFVAYSHRQLTLSELKAAVSVPHDRPQTERDLIPNFEKALGSLSGSLVEISAEGGVQFIHLSTQGYFIEILISPARCTTAPRILKQSRMATSSIWSSRTMASISTGPTHPSNSA